MEGMECALFLWLRAETFIYGDHLTLCCAFRSTRFPYPISVSVFLFRTDFSRSFIFFPTMWKVKNVVIEMWFRED